MTSHQLPVISEKPLATFQAYRVIPQRRPGFVRRIIDRVNWSTVFEWSLWVGVILIWAVIAILVYVPFVSRLVWR